MPTSKTSLWYTTNTKKIHLTQIVYSNKLTTWFIYIWDTLITCDQYTTSGSSLTKTIDLIIDTNTQIQGYAYDNSSNWYFKSIYIKWYYYRPASGSGRAKWYARSTYIKTLWKKENITIFWVHINNSRVDQTNE